MKLSGLVVSGGGFAVYDACEIMSMSESSKVRYFIFLIISFLLEVEGFSGELVTELYCFLLWPMELQHIMYVFVVRRIGTGYV